MHGLPRLIFSWRSYWLYSASEKAIGVHHYVVFFIIWFDYPRLGLTFFVEHFFQISLASIILFSSAPYKTIGISIVMHIVIFRFLNKVLNFRTLLSYKILHLLVESLTSVLTSLTRVINNPNYLNLDTFLKYVFLFQYIILVY